MLLLLPSLYVVVFRLLKEKVVPLFERRGIPLIVESWPYLGLTGQCEAKFTRTLVSKHACHCEVCSIGAKLER